jgi:hypothetical protein
MKINHLAIVKTVLLIALAATCSFAQKGREEFQAQAFGEGTQAGHTFNVTVIINEYSTEEDQQVLFDAYKKSGMNGVTNALNKMKTKGRLSITGTLGYDVTYIRVFPTATGRKIRLVTDRPITFGEAWTDSRSQDFNLSALELDLDADSKNKSKGQLLPLCQFKITPDKEVHVELYQNPWRLTDVLDRSKK